MAHVTKKKTGVYLARVSVRDRATGKYRLVSRQIKARTLTDARDKAKDFEREVKNGTVSATVVTLNDAIDEWLALQANDIEASTHETYSWYYKAYIKEGIGTMSLRRLGVKDLNHEYNKVLTPRLAPSTIRKVHNIITPALELAMAEEWIRANPAKSARLPKIQSTDPPLIEDATIAKLIKGAFARTPEFGVFIRLAAMSGLRRGELCALHWEDWESDTQTLRVRRAITHTAEGYKEKRPKSGRGNARSLDELTASLLDEHPHYGPYIFTMDGQRFWQPSYVSHQFVSLCKDVGVSGVRFHDLRHWHATAAVAGGHDARVIADRLGHKSPLLTLKTYAASSPANDQKLADSVAKRLEDLTKKQK